VLKFQNSSTKADASAVWSFEFESLIFICDVFFGACNLMIFGKELTGNQAANRIS
jgi:hypothetical protein